MTGTVPEPLARGSAYVACASCGPVGVWIVTVSTRCCPTESDPLVGAPVTFDRQSCSRPVTLYPNVRVAPGRSA